MPLNFGELGHFLQFAEMIQGEEFIYEIPLKLTYSNELGDLLVNPKFNSIIHKENVTIEFSSNLNGIKSHPISGSIRDCLAKYLYSKSYQEIVDSPNVLTKFNTLLRLLLRDLYGPYTTFYKSTEDIYISNNNGEIKKKEKDLNTINSFIKLLALTSLKDHTLKLDHSFYSEGSFLFNLEHKDSFKVVKELISLEVSNWLNDLSRDNKAQLTIYTINYLKNKKISPSTTIEYLTTLNETILLLSPKVRDESSTKRILKSLMNQTNTSLINLYKYVNKTEGSGVKTDRHLTILHLFASLGLIREKDAIYESIYDPDITKSYLKDKVKDYMKNKVK